MRILTVLAIAGLLAGCPKSNPANQIPNACLAAQVLAADEQARLRATTPDRHPTLKLEFCRVVPDYERNKAMALVSIAERGEAGMEEALVVGRLMFGSDGWVLISSEPIYAGLPLEPKPQPAIQDAGTVQNQ